MKKSANPSYINHLLQLSQRRFDHLSQQSIKPIEFDIEQPLYPQLSTLIQQLQINKYPNPPYNCQNLIVHVDGEDIPVTYVKSQGNINLDATQRQHIAAHALLVRELVLADTLARYAAAHLTATQSVGINIALKDLIEAELPQILEQRHTKPLDTYARTNEFIAKLANILMENSNLSRGKAIDQIKNYERYVISEQNTKRVIINESILNGYSTIQMDVPLAGTLTEAQKREYSRIFTPKDNPAWFRALKKEEQEWYKARVPKDLQDTPAWERFAAINKTSAMQQGLENKNARQNYLFLDHCLVAQSTKVATLSPIEVKKTDRQRLTALNAEQLVEHLLSSATQDFRKHWAIPLDDNQFQLKPLLFIHSLLSPLPLNLADSKMIKGQQAALEVIKQRHSQQCHLVYGNDAVNILRKLDNQASNWQHTEQLIKYAKDLLINLPSSNLLPEMLENSIANPSAISSTIIPDLVYSGSSAMQFQGQKKNITLIVAAITELEKLRTTPEIADRNKAAFKSAYQGLLVEALGGKISSNCKSGKDRTGLDEIYRHAMRVYFDRYACLPSYHDSKNERQNFIEIFEHFYNTLKIHEAAANNTPGSFGIKDSAKMLCGDMAKFIGENYQASNQRANINKTTESFAQKMRYGAATLFNNGITFLGNVINKGFDLVLRIIGAPVKKATVPEIERSLQTDPLLRIYSDWKQKEKNYLLEKHYYKGTFNKLEATILAYSKAEPTIDALINIRYELGCLFQQASFQAGEAPHLAALYCLYAEIGRKLHRLEKPTSTEDINFSTELKIAVTKTQLNRTSSCTTEVTAVVDEKPTTRLISKH